MRFGRAGARLFLKGLGAVMAALLGALLLVSSASALTWGEINQKIGRCITLTDEATTAVKEIATIEIKDETSKKKAVATLKKAEKNLRQVVDIYQSLSKADLPPAQIMPSISKEIKSEISRNLELAKHSLQQAQSLRPVLDEVLRDRERRLRELARRLKGRYDSSGFSGPAGVKAGLRMDDLLTGLGDLRHHTSLLHKRLQAQNLR